MRNSKNYSPHFVYLPKAELEQKALQTNLQKKGKISSSPLSGSEPPYEPQKWNLNPNIKSNHNCYSYAMNHLNPGRKGKPQPGYFSGYDHIQDNEYNCENFRKRLSSDIPSLYLTSFEQPCEKGFHKGFIALDPSDDPDYHFYRQDNNGKWSHKPGRTDAQNLDASGNPISNPHTANRNYTHFSYNKPCFFFCVNKKLGRSHATKINTKKSFFNF